MRNSGPIWRECALLIAICFASAGLSVRSAEAAPDFVAAGGLGGERDYEQRFAGLAKALDKLFKAAAGDAHVYTFTGTDATKAHITDTLSEIAREAKPDDEFTLVLIGHGSFDGETYKFNLPGPDISGDDLSALCNRIAPKRPFIVTTPSPTARPICSPPRPPRNP